MSQCRFLWGMAAGVAVGVLGELLVCPHPKCRKTAAGKAMQRMGNALDTVMAAAAKQMN